MGLWSDLKGSLIQRRGYKIKEFLMDLERDLKKYTRNSEEYYKTDNDPRTNAEIYAKEIKQIEGIISQYKRPIVRYFKIEQIKKLNRILYERAELWDQFRREGLNMPEEKFNRLVVIEENSYYGEADKLWEIREKFKEGQEKVASIEKRVKKIIYPPVRSSETSPEKPVENLNTQLQRFREYDNTLDNR